MKTACLLTLSLLILSCKKFENCDRIYNTAKIPLVTKIAFGSCASQNVAQPILYTVVAQHPDIFIYLGDNIYGDTHNMRKLDHEYYKLCSKSEFQNLISSCRVLATWDDHDYGQNDSGNDYPEKEKSKQLFLKFWGEPFGSDRWYHPGIFTSYIFGDTAHSVQVILLDCRTFRDPLIEDYQGYYIPNTSDKATMLGDDQWRWLKRELQKPAKLRIIGSSTQFLRSYNGIETWANFPKEQIKMFELFRSLNINNAFFISGDVHLGELSKVEYPGIRPILDLTSSGLTSNKEQDGDIPNSNRIENSVYRETNFGMLEIDWSQQPVQVDFKIYNGDGVVRMDHIEHY